MANIEVTKKVKFVGVWHEDVFTDAVVKTIAGHASAVKGKKIKVRLNTDGLRLTRPKLLTENETQFYPLDHVQTVARNPLFSSCVMFILPDPRKKYKIIALRCENDGDAIHFNSMFSQMKKDQKFGNVELKQRDTGNWTLRDRSAHNASRHLAEIFSERKKSTDTNGEPVLKPNGDIVHEPVLDASKATENRQGSYIKRNGNQITNNNIATTPVISPDDSEYVIETEVSEYPYSVPIKNPQPNGEAYNGELDTLKQDVREIKTMLAQKSSNDYPGTGLVTLPSRPVMYTGSEIPSPTHSGPVILRAPAKTYEAKRASSSAGTYSNPWASHRRLSGDFYIPQKANVANGSVKSNRSRASISSRGGSLFSVPSTVEKSIESTYPRHSLIKRHNSALVARNRPSSLHVMGKNELTIYHTVGDRYVAV